MSALIQSLATVSIAVAAVKSVRLYVHHAHTRHVQEKRKAFQLYVETGEKSKAFYALSGSAAKAARRQRLRIIKAKSQDNQVFTAFTECPQCSTFDVHYIKDTMFVRSIRECKKCRYTWRQNK